MNEAVNLYTQDFYAWTINQAHLLREQCVTEIDCEHLALELEHMGASQKRALQSRLEVLIAHLMKLVYLPALKVNNERGWHITIREQRRRIKEELEDCPSLKSQLTVCTARAYSYAVDSIVRQFDIDETTLPPTCPYSLEQLLNMDFYP